MQSTKKTEHTKSYFESKINESKKVLDKCWSNY